MKYVYRAILTVAAYENAILPEILYYPLTNKVITVVGYDNLLRQPNLVVNSLVCCKDLFTRILNDQRSTIDCVLLSKQLANNVNSVCIDEDGQYDLHSDHVKISTCLCNTDTKETKTMSKSKDRFFWKITDDTDWDSFQNYLESSFTADWVNKNNDINTLWSFWKTKVNGAAE